MSAGISHQSRCSRHGAHQGHIQSSPRAPGPCLPARYRALFLTLQNSCPRARRAVDPSRAPFTHHHPQLARVFFSASQPEGQPTGHARVEGKGGVRDSVSPRAVCNVVRELERAMEDVQP